jgi:Ca-activated chloride channel family protein
MRVGVAVRPLLLLACLSWAIAQDVPTFRTAVSLVHVDVQVTAADGRLLDGLGKDNFLVFDEGKPQPIVQFATGQEELDLILLFDVSGSMKPKVAEVAAAAKLGMAELQHGDRVAIMVFNTKSRMLMPFTEDLESVQRGIQQDVLALKFGGGTFIQTAAEDAAKRLAREPRTARRRAVLIITDDYGQRTRRESNVVREFWEADAILSALVVRGKAEQTIHAINVAASPYLMPLLVGVKGITDKTGGDFVRSDDPGTTFQESMHRIRSRYSLYYPMPEGKPGSNRSIRVELAGEISKQSPKPRVRARTGYVMPADSHAPATRP